MKVPAAGRIRGSLTRLQEAALATRFADVRLRADHTWPGGATVLEFTASAGRYILKAAENSHHLAREARAHREWLGQLTGDVPEFVLYDAAAGLLVTRYIPGQLAKGAPQELAPDTYRQAGSLLARMHRGDTGAPRLSTRYEAAVARKAASLAERSVGLAPGWQLAEASAWLERFTPAPVDLVPTHGDFHPRNWLVRADGTLALIDFGRAELRPWYTDLVRLEHQEFVGRNDLRRSLLDGYGPEADAPRTPGVLLDHVAQSLGTLVWAHERGDVDFEEQGRRMLATTTARLRSTD